MEFYVDGKHRASSCYYDLTDTFKTFKQLSNAGPRGMHASNMLAFPFLDLASNFMRKLKGKIILLSK